MRAEPDPLCVRPATRHRVGYDLEHAALVDSIPLEVDPAGNATHGLPPPWPHLVPPAHLASVWILITNYSLYEAMWLMIAGVRAEPDRAAAEPAGKCPG